MKRRDVLMLLGVLLLAGPSHSPPVQAGADDQVPTPVAVAAPEPEFVDAPPPVTMESEFPASSSAELIHPDDFPVCPDCAPCGRGPLQRYWHERAKPCLQATHWGYPENFCERSFGTTVRSAISAQVENGLAAQLTLYRCDFVTATGEDGTDLNRRGRERLERLVRLASLTFHPLVIESDETNRALNQARRAHVVEHLKRLAPDVSEERVVVARPLVRGMAGQEAVRVYDNWLLRVQSGAAPSFGRTNVPGGISSGPGFPMGGDYDVNRGNQGRVPQ